jgi:hypothetical protein
MFKLETNNFSPDQQQLRAGALFGFDQEVVLNLQNMKAIMQNQTNQLESISSEISGNFTSENGFHEWNHVLVQTTFDLRICLSD